MPLPTVCDVTLGNFLEHKRNLLSRSSGDRDTFLKDPVSLDLIKDPVFWVDRLWNRETIRRLIDTARANRLVHVIHPHNRSKIVSLNEPLINAGYCKRLIDEAKSLPSSVAESMYIPLQRQPQPQLQPQQQQQKKSLPSNLTDNITNWFSSECEGFLSV
jgi:hypothetical protein